MRCYDFDPATLDAKKNVTSGLLSTGTTQVFAILVQFLSMVVLSRMLLPEDFGLVAMVSPVYGFILLFQDVGLAQATIQKSSLKHLEANAFFWMNVLVGACLALFLGLSGALVADFYGDARVSSLTAAMGLMILITSLGNQHNAILQRRMQFRALAVINILSLVNGLAVAAVFAYLKLSYWALYLGMLATCCTTTIGAWVASKWCPSIPKELGCVRDMLHFGMCLSTSNIMGFIARNIDNILIGRSWGQQQLGLYDRAYKLLMFPLQRMVGPIGNVMVPVLSRLLEDQAKYERLFLQTLAAMAMLLWPGILWVIVYREQVVNLLLGAGWDGVSSIFYPLAIAAFAQVVNNPTGWLFVTQGRGKDFLRVGLITASSSVVAIIIGLPYGPFGVATAYAISEFLRTPIIWWLATRNGHVSLSCVIRAISPQVFALALTAVLLQQADSILVLPALLRLGLGLVLSYAVFTGALLLTHQGRTTASNAYMAVLSFIQRRSL